MSFSFDVEKFAKKAGVRTDQAVRATIAGVCRNIVKRTPVDTGRARGNWFASIGAPIQSTTTTADKSGNTVINKAQSFIEDAPGSVFYFSNNLPYIEKLEFGSSTQAPQGMVRLSVNEYQQHLSKLEDN